MPVDAGYHGVADAGTLILDSGPPFESSTHDDWPVHSRGSSNFQRRSDSMELKERRSGGCS